MRPDRVDGSAGRVTPRPYAPERSAPPAPLISRPPRPLRPFPDLVRDGGPDAPQRMPDRSRRTHLEEGHDVAAADSEGPSFKQEQRIQTAELTNPAEQPASSSPSKAEGSGKNLFDVADLAEDVCVPIDGDSESSGEENDAIRTVLYEDGPRSWTPMSVDSVTDEEGVESFVVPPRLKEQVDFIEDSLRQNIDSPSEAEKGMLALARFALSTEGPDSLSLRRAALLQSSVLSAVVLTVKRFYDVPGTATVGFSLISALAADDREMEVALGRAGAVETAVERLEADKSVSDVRGPTKARLSALCAMCGLTYAEENRLRMREHNGIETVIDTMAKSAGCLEVQIKCSTLLANCAFGNEENKRFIAERNGIGLVVSAMQAFPGSMQLQSFASLVLRNLTFNAPSIVEDAGRQGAVRAVLLAIKAHPTALDVVDQASVGLLNMVAVHAGNVERMTQTTDYAGILVSALAARAGDGGTPSPVAATVLSVMEVAARARPGTVAALVGADAVAAIVGAMRGRVTQRAVVFHGAAALRAVLRHAEQRPAAMRALARAGGLPALLELLYIASACKASLSAGS